MEAKLEAEINTIREKMDGNKEKIDAWLEEMMAWLKDTTACQEATEACLEKAKANPERSKAGLQEMEVVAEHQKVPKEEAAVETIGALKEWYGGRQLAIGRRRRQKKRTQSDGASQKKLVAALRGMTCSAVPAPRKGRSRQGPGKDNVDKEPRNDGCSGTDVGLNRNAKSE
jgi:hypothetical protein